MPPPLNTALLAAVANLDWSKLKGPITQQVQELARTYRVNQRTIYKYIRRAGVVIDIDRRRWGSIQDDALRSLAARSAKPLNLLRTARELGRSNWLVRVHAVRLGIVLRTRGTWSPQRFAILDQYVLNGRLTVTEAKAARACKVSVANLIKTMKARNIQARQGKGIGVNDAQVLALHAAGFFAHQAIARLGTSYSDLRNREKRLGIAFPRVRRPRSGSSLQPLAQP